MKNKPNRNNRKELSDAEVEAALYAALRDEGYLFPESAEEIASLEARLDTSGVPTPDAYKFTQLLQRQNADETNKVVRFPHSARAVSANIEENLAVAARNGGTISAAIRKQMDMDRQSAQERCQKRKYATH
jgi:hypothetical protein